MLVHANSPMIIQSPNMVCHVMSCHATIKGIKASGGTRIRLPKRESSGLMSNLWLVPGQLKGMAGDPIAVARMDQMGFIPAIYGLALNPTTSSFFSFCNCT